MMAAMKSEIRKLLTVRSTYITIVLSLLFMAFVSFYIEGYRNSGHGLDAHKLSGVALGSTSFISQVAAITAILFMAHEYRHNLISYTLTLNNSRTKVLLAKIATISLFVALFTLLGSVMSVLLAYAGLRAKGIDLPPQTFDALYIFGRSVYYCLAFSLAGMMVATLLRNVVAAVAFLFIVPSTIEGLLTLLLKDKAVYLPFSALQQVISVSGQQNTFTQGRLSPSKGAVIFGLYLLVAWVITWLLFLKRDAN